MARKLLLLVQGLCIFGVMIWFHDGGLPKTLSDADQAYVLQQSQVVENRFQDLIDRTRRFVAEPEREREVSGLLVEAVDSWVEICDTVYDDKRFFVEFDRYKKHREGFADLEKQLDAALEEMIDEIVARTDRGEYDQESYDRLEMSFLKMSKTPTKPTFGICEPRKCILCAFRHLLLK